MNYIKKNYIDSHWLVFIFQGIIAFLAGCISLFTGGNRSADILPIIGLFLLGLAMVEFANSIYRSYNRHGWAVSFLVALLMRFSASWCSSWLISRPFGILPSWPLTRF